MKQKLAAIISLIALTFIMTLASCAPITDGAGEDSSQITIKLPPIASYSIRALTTEQVSRIQRETAKYRVTFSGAGQTITREGDGTTFSAIFPTGAQVGVTVYCLNRKGEVIVKTVRKTVTMKSGTNSVSFKLSEDGEEIEVNQEDPPNTDTPGDGDTPTTPPTTDTPGGSTPGGDNPPTPQPVTGTVSYDGGTGASNVPSDTQTYETGNEVTLQTGEPTRAGYEFAGWTSNVELKYDNAGQEQTILQGVEFASGGSNVATNIKIANFKMPEGGVVLTAKWTPVTYNITYNDTNGGTGSANTANATISFNIETQTITFAAEGTLAKVGDEFAGWETSNGTDVRGMNAAELIALITSGDTLALRVKWHEGVRTVLYDDGTLIINELPANRKTNVNVTQTYEAMKDDGSNYVFTTLTDAPWYNDRSSITSVEIGSNISPTKTVGWFFYLSNCTSINLTNLDTSKVTSMGEMFNNCLGLTSLDVSNFDTSNVTSTAGMFYNCSGLESLTFGNDFDTSQVTSMLRMFYGCSKLETIYASSSFVTSSVTDDTDMFANCTALRGGQNTTYDASNVDSTYARIDGGTAKPGYFTDIADKP